MSESRSQSTNAQRTQSTSPSKIQSTSASIAGSKSASRTHFISASRSQSTSHSRIQSTSASIAGSKSSSTAQSLSASRSKSESVEDPIYESVEDPIYESVEDPIYESVQGPIYECIQGRIYECIHGQYVCYQHSIENISKVHTNEKRQFIEIDGVVLWGFQEQGQCLFIGLAAHTIFVSYVSRFSSFIFMGQQCGGRGRTNSVNLSPSLALPTCCNNYNNKITLSIHYIIWQNQLLLVTLWDLLRACSPLEGGTLS